VVDHALVQLALDRAPTLLLDCSTSANAHAHIAEDQAFHNVYVVEIELIYKLRDVLRETKLLVRRFQPKFIILTTFNRLFNYQDEEENLHIYTQCWNMITELSQEYNVIAGIPNRGMQHAFAKARCELILEQA